MVDWRPMRFVSPEGMRQVTREEMKFIDSVAMESFKVAGSALMETAGRAAAECVADLVGGVAGKRIPVLIGTGANGGDGCVAARTLANWGASVSLYMTGRAKEMADLAAAANLHAVERMGIPVTLLQTQQGATRAIAEMGGAACIVDAILGTGLSALTGRVREPAGFLIDQVNALGIPIVAIDIPSGLDANTGQKIGTAIRATVTVTMGLPKKGFFLADGPAVTGKLLVADLGYPRVLLTEAEGIHLHRRIRPTGPGKDEGAKEGEKT